MQDQHIYLDASFDQRAKYTLVAWLRPRDTFVNMGESIAIVQDGSIRRVVTAPCSGVIVAVYADAGASLLPRSLIATIRPGLPYTPHINNMGTTIVAAALIGATIVLIPLFRGLIHVTRTDTTAQLASETQVPSPTVSIVALTPTLASGESAIPQATATIDSMATAEPLPSLGSDKNTISKIHTLFTELVNLCNEIRPWIERGMPIDQHVSTYMITPREDRRNPVIEQLRAIVADKRSLPDVSSTDAQLYDQLEQLMEPCIAIFEEVRTANSQATPPRDLNAEYNSCNTSKDYLTQYLQQP